MSPSNRENIPSVWVKVTATQPTGRQGSPFGLGSDGYVKFLRPAFAEAMTRRQMNNVTE